MIKNSKLLQKFEDEYSRKKGKLSYKQAIKIFQAMWDEGVHLGVLPPKDEMDGTEIRVKIAKIIHSCLKKP